jgi:hypothetical protein
LTGERASHYHSIEPKKALREFARSTRETILKETHDHAQFA